MKISHRLILILPVLSMNARSALQTIHMHQSKPEFSQCESRERLCLRGGVDARRTGKFVVEHRPSKIELNETNSTILRKASYFSNTSLNDLYELEGVLGKHLFWSVRAIDKEPF